MFHFCSNPLSEEISKINTQAINGRIVTVSVLDESSIFFGFKSISRGSECFENAGELGKKSKVTNAYSGAEYKAVIDGSGSVPSKDKGIKGKPSASRRLSSGLLKLTGGTGNHSKMIIFYNRSLKEWESPMRKKKEQLWILTDL